MRFLKNLFEMGKVLFIQDRETYHRPEILSENSDQYGNVVQQYIYANSGHESTLHLEGTTIQGDRSVVSTHRTDIARGIFDVHVEGSEDYDVYEYLRDRNLIPVDWDASRLIQEVAWLNSDLDS